MSDYEADNNANFDEAMKNQPTQDNSNGKGKDHIKLQSTAI